MPSASTQVIAARIPNRDAEQLRLMADTQGVTVSDVLKAALSVSLHPADPARIPQGRRPPMISESVPPDERDLRARADELRAVARRLWPDRDDGAVLSELQSVVSQLRQVQAQLKGLKS